MPPKAIPRFLKSTLPPTSANGAVARDGPSQQTQAAPHAWFSPELTSIGLGLVPVASVLLHDEKNSRAGYRQNQYAAKDDPYYHARPFLAAEPAALVLNFRLLALCQQHWPFTLVVDCPWAPHLGHIRECRGHLVNAQGGHHLLRALHKPVELIQELVREIVGLYTCLN